MQKYLVVFLMIFNITVIIAQEKYTTEDAVKHYGEEATVTGIVTQVSTPRNGIIYLNMGGKFPDNVFTGVIFKKEAAAFENVKELEGKKVELTGMIVEYKGKPQIILKKPDQIKVVE